MTGAELRVADMASYLQATGWRRSPEMWRGASLWQNPDGVEVLVPARDGLDYSDRRTAELLDVLMKVEGRAAEEIAEEISSPMMDAQSVRTFPNAAPSGWVGLGAGLQALGGIRSLYAVAARTELEGSRLVYHGRHEGAEHVVDAIQLGPTKPGSYTFTMRVPAQRDHRDILSDHADYLPRLSTVRLFYAVGAAQQAVAQAIGSERGLVAFDETVGAGVSANFCEALADLGGVGRRRQPFEVGFRWARGRPADLPAATLAFEASAGGVLRDAANRLRRLDATGRAVVTGLVERLHDRPQQGDRWRVEVRGEVLSVEAGIRESRTIWLQLGSDDYDRAWQAHREIRTVRATGTKTQSNRRAELIVDRGGFDVLPEGRTR
jgi:hypothetical protein